MIGKVRIPSIGGPYVSPDGVAAEMPLPQPMMEFKELEPDYVRWQQWKDSLARKRRKKRNAQ